MPPRRDTQVGTGRPDAATFYRRHGKRWSDIVLGSVALVLLAPLLLGIALVLRVVQGAPVLFRHQRPGFRGRPFTLIKFRTMTAERDASGNLLPDGQRLTRFGAALRRWSLDELPELLNVVKGEMSLVGPRPLLMEYMPRYSPRQARRHEVVPGITGWAQVNGRNAASWAERFELDLWYVDHLSPWIDVKIFWLTVVQVLRREGINQPGRATVDYFQGNEPANLSEDSERNRA